MKQSASRAVLSITSMVGSCFLGACASREESAPTFEASKLGAMERVHSFDGIYLASQPAPDDLKAAKEAGVRTVLNLRRKEEVVDWDEKVVAEALGLEYDTVPFGAATELTDDVFDETREILRDTAKRPILVHCASANRVAAVWLAYRVLDDGVPLDAALEEAKAAGLKVTAFEEKARAYIEKQRK
jgi:uncharacterized protein (TIGR01244 family)